MNSHDSFYFNIVLTTQYLHINSYKTKLLPNDQQQKEFRLLSIFGLTLFSVHILLSEPLILSFLFFTLDDIFSATVAYFMNKKRNILLINELFYNIWLWVAFSNILVMVFINLQYFLCI